ncbi:MAG: hypothetical protein ABGX24_01175, partial [Aquificota bacterium]
SHPVGGTGTPHRPKWVVIAQPLIEVEKPSALAEGVSSNITYSNAGIFRKGTEKGFKGKFQP